MSELPEQDWADLGGSWRNQDADMGLSEHALQARLRRQRLMTSLLTGGEALSLAVVLAIAVWMSRNWLAEPGASPILILFLLTPTGMVLWQRWRRRASEAVSGLEGIDAVIAREARLLESIRLGSVMSHLALAAMIMMVLAHIYHHSLVISSASVASIALMYLYVFGLQIGLIVWTLRLRRRHDRLEAVRNALHPPE
jgi:hypothetical protein